jgi:Baseplate hub gp41
MTQKFGRNFRVTIDPMDGMPPIIIAMPFTIRFWLQRNTLSDLNRLSIDIYNLSEAHRNRIFQDRFDLTQNRTIVFEAGYSTLYRIFQGRIYEASSAREGTNIVTRIEARDGLYDIAVSQVFQTLQSGMTLGDVFKFLIGQFPTLGLGAVGNYNTPMLRPPVLNGSTWSMMRQYAPNDVYIDSGKVYVMKQAEVLEGEPYQIDDSTGLLETPRRDEGFLSVTSLMETGVNMAALVNLKSTVQPAYNGQYKVIGINHAGTISGAVCGECRSVFSFLAPAKFKAFTEIPGQ